MKLNKFLLSTIFIFIISTNFFSLFASSQVYKQNVTASYYAEAFHGKKTSNGEIFNMYSLTCAHKSLPFNTILKVTNLKNGKSVNVRVNDRGPFVAGREIDLSKAAAVKLGMIGSGTTKVKLEIVKMGPNTKASAQTAAKATQMMKKIDPKYQNSSQNYHSKPTNIHRKEGTTWDIQFGVYSSKENANKKAQSLIKAGFSNVAFQTNKINGTTKVIIKNIDASQVNNLEKKLIQKGFNEYLIKQRNK